MTQPGPPGFLGPLTAPRSWLEQAGGLVSQRPPRWLSLRPGEREQLTRACEPAMARLYPQEAGQARRVPSPEPA